MRGAGGRCGKRKKDRAFMPCPFYIFLAFRAGSQIVSYSIKVRTDYGWSVLRRAVVLEISVYF